MAALALLLPLISLMALGSLWLWQHGFVLYWALGACFVTLLTYALERWVFRVDLPENAKGADAKAAEAADPAWSVREAAAWTAIVDLSNQVRPLEIASRDDVFDLGVRAVETVARSMHPGEDHALWKFTLPEALALVERVSSQLSEFVSDNIPLGDRMTVGQFLRVYRWRSAVNVAEQAYDLWRIIRLINPAAAATQEIREQLTRRAYDWGREELAKRLAQAYVREVGRAAMDLYSGRMRLAEHGEKAAAAPRPSTDAASGTNSSDSEPVRILFAGPAASGRSAVIDGLLSDTAAPVQQPASAVDYTARESRLGATPGNGQSVLLINSPDLTERTVASKSFLAAVEQSDVIVWITAAAPDMRPLETRALDTIRRQAAARVRRKPQPILCVWTGIDDVQCRKEGRPSEIQSGLRPAPDTAIQIALKSVSETLGMSSQDIISVSLAGGTRNDIERVRSQLAALLPEANRVKALRLRETAKTGLKWGRVWTQVINAGRALKDGTS